MMKVALFRNPLSGIEMVSGESSDKYCNITGMVRVSGWAEVEFPPLESSALAEKLGQIDAEMSKATHRYHQTLSGLEKQKVALAALTEHAIAVTKRVADDKFSLNSGMEPEQA
jgi:hypothetical protein